MAMRIRLFDLSIHSIGLCWAPGEGPNPGSHLRVLEGAELVQFFSWARRKLNDACGARVLIAICHTTSVDSQMEILEPDGWLKFRAPAASAAASLCWGAGVVAAPPEDRDGFTISSDKVALVYIGQSKKSGVRSPALCIEYGIIHPETEEVLRRSESFSLLDWWQETHAEAA